MAPLYQRLRPVFARHATLNLVKTVTLADRHGCATLNAPIYSSLVVVQVIAPIKLTRTKYGESCERKVTELLDK